MKRYRPESPEVGGLRNPVCLLPVPKLIPPDWSCSSLLSYATYWQRALQFARVQHI